MLTSKERFLTQMKSQGIEVREVSPQFPYQDSRQECTAFEAINRKLKGNFDHLKMYVCFSSEGKLLAKNVEVVK